MKIIGISSGTSYNGNAAVLVREALNGASQRGAVVEEIHLPDYNIDLCKGCYNCLSKGRCQLGDDLEKIRQKILEADGIILGSAAFGQELNVSMKNFLDRISLYSMYTSALSDKYVVGIVSSETPGAGGRHIVKQLTKIVFSFFKSGYRSGMLNAVTGWDKVNQYPEYLSKAHQLGGKLVKDLELKRGNGWWQHYYHQIIQRLFWLEEVKKSVISQKDGRMKAVYQHLLSKGLLSKEETGSTAVNMTMTVRT